MSGRESERIEEEEDSLERDSSEPIEESYSEFQSESIEESGAIKSQSLKKKASEIEESGYSDDFVEASMGQSAALKGSIKDVQAVSE